MDESIVKKWIREGKKEAGETMYVTHF